MPRGATCSLTSKAITIVGGSTPLSATSPRSRQTGNPHNPVSTFPGEGHADNGSGKGSLCGGADGSLSVGGFSRGGGKAESGAGDSDRGETSLHSYAANSHCYDFPRYSHSTKARQRYSVEEVYRRAFRLLVNY